MENNSITPRHADMIIKICGMSRPDNIAQVAALAPMLMGFIFHDKSPRDASRLPANTLKSLPAFIRPVAVFVNRTIDEVTNVTDSYGFKIVQLHGDETPEFCRQLKARGLTVFKSIGVDAGTVWNDYAAYNGSIDMFVLDRKSSCHGGTGRKFDWRLLEKYDLPIPYLLGGGIGPDDIPAILKVMRPGMAGIDINSRFESAPGIKDLGKLINFIVSLRKFNEYEPDKIPFWEKA